MSDIPKLERKSQDLSFEAAHRGLIGQGQAVEWRGRNVTHERASIVGCISSILVFSGGSILESLPLQCAGAGMGLLTAIFAVKSLCNMVYNSRLTNDPADMHDVYV